MKEAVARQRVPWLKMMNGLGRHLGMSRKEEIDPVGEGLTEGLNTLRRRLVLVPGVSFNFQGPHQNVPLQPPFTAYRRRPPQEFDNGGLHVVKFILRSGVRTTEHYAGVGRSEYMGNSIVISVNSDGVGDRLQACRV